MLCVIGRKQLSSRPLPGAGHGGMSLCGGDVFVASRAYVAAYITFRLVIGGVTGNGEKADDKKKNNRAH
jgi:hypothetical protein